MEEKELRKLAADIYEGKVFTSSQCKANDIPFVFLPIGLGALSDKTKEELENLGLIYEYISAAGPRCINGNPTFFSMRTLTIEELETLNTYYSEYDELKKNWER